MSNAATPLFAAIFFFIMGVVFCLGIISMLNLSTKSENKQESSIDFYKLPKRSKLKRLCPKHAKSFLKPGQLALHSLTNCDECKKELTKKPGKP